MAWFVVMSGCGLLVGLLLFRKIPIVGESSAANRIWSRIAVVIPCRNEESNLPALLRSLAGSEERPAEVIVVDDGSTDNTAAAAVSHGARVIASETLPQGWTGKTWACRQGAAAADSETLLFLDADTRFVLRGYQRLIDHFHMLPNNAALSLLPFHRTERWYEELSLFFNVLMAMGAGGFGRLDSPRLFGQSLLMRKEMYLRAGGHEAVKKEILENLHFASCVRAAGGATYTLGGRGTLETRMFPHGLEQLCESWRKAFVAGAGATSPQVLALAIYWLAGAMLAFLLLFVARGPLWFAAVAVYLLYAVQIAWYGWQLGTFRWITYLAYPVPLVFYFILFGQSAGLRIMRRPVSWKGRRM
jgi:4,4'-diaponeurosporenoate glycosyltransferase